MSPGTGSAIGGFLGLFAGVAVGFVTGSGQDPADREINAFRRKRIEDGYDGARTWSRQEVIDEMSLASSFRTGLAASAGTLIGGIIGASLSKPTGT